MLVLSGGAYLSHQGTIEGVRELGFPDFFRIQLAFLKLLAVPTLLIPQVPHAAKEWAYSGVALFLLTAVVAHHAHGDPIALNLVNLCLFGILAASSASLP